LNPRDFDWVREQVAEFEASGGTRANTLWDTGYPIVVITSIGARSNTERKNPVMRVEKDGDYLAVASLGGAPMNPSWYHNLVANPVVQLQDGPARRPYVAHLLSGEEREQWWVHAVDTEYQAKTERQIPLFRLTPVSTQGDFR
jgi:deazaflavin-dependent oxidoreductase (nitroreductase family)